MAISNANIISEQFRSRISISEHLILLFFSVGDQKYLYVDAHPKLACHTTCVFFIDRFNFLKPPRVALLRVEICILSTHFEHQHVVSAFFKKKKSEKTKDDIGVQYTESFILTDYQL